MKNNTPQPQPQQDITDVGADTSYVRIGMSNLYIKISSIHNFFWSVSGSSQVSCKIIFNCLVLPKYLTVL